MSPVSDHLHQKPQRCTVPRLFLIKLITPVLLKALRHKFWCTGPAFVYITYKPSLLPTKYGHLNCREEKREGSPPPASLSITPTLIHNLKNHAVHQFQTVLHNYFLSALLDCINFKLSPSSV